MKRNRYFVSFLYEAQNRTGLGNATLTTNYTINSDEHISEIEKEISKNNNNAKIVLMNYILMKEEG